MQISAEARWFWRQDPPPGLEEWFRDAGGNSIPACGPEERTDLYLRDPKQAELGLKERGATDDGEKDRGTEIKGLVATRWDVLVAGPLAGPVELWSKWKSGSLELDPHPVVRTRKSRWLRKFDTSSSHPREIRLGPDGKPADPKQPLPSMGCNVELTEIKLDSGEVWWSFGLEAFGPMETVHHSLLATATLLVERGLPPLGQGIRASYPAWLQNHAGKP